MLNGVRGQRKAMVCLRHLWVFRWGRSPSGDGVVDDDRKHYYIPEDNVTRKYIKRVGAIYIHNRSIVDTFDTRRL